MSEEINRVKVFQDAIGEWWLEFYANDVRHQVTIKDVMNGLASFVNMQETNAVLHERINDLESRLTMRAADVCPVCAGLKIIRNDDGLGSQVCPACNGTGQRR